MVGSGARQEVRRSRYPQSALVDSAQGIQRTSVEDLGVEEKRSGLQEEAAHVLTCLIPTDGADDWLQPPRAERARAGEPGGPGKRESRGRESTGGGRSAEAARRVEGGEGVE